VVSIIVYVLVSQALVKRTGPDEQPAGSPVSPVEKTPFSVPTGGRRRGKGRGRRGRRKERKKRREREGKQKTKRKLRDYTRRSSFPSLPVLKIVQQIDVSAVWMAGVWGVCVCVGGGGI